MLNVVNLGDNSERVLSPAELKGQDISNLWLELVDPSEEELLVVAEAVQVPVNFLRLSKAKGYVDLRLEQGHAVVDFVVTKETISAKDSVPIILVISKNFLVTVEKKEVEPIIEAAKEGMHKVKVDPPAQVAYFIIDEIVANHYLHLETLETSTSKIEEEVVQKVSPDTLRRIFTLKSKLIRFNKVLWYERGLVFNLHKCNEGCMTAKTRELFDTTHEDLTRQIDIVETYREILSDAINVYLSAVSNKINLSIKALTVVIFYLTIITTVTSFPNTVATFFGISQFGNTSIVIIAVAVILSIALPFLWLWRKRWLKFQLPDET